MIIFTTIPLSFIFFKGQIKRLKEIFYIELVSSPGKKLKEVSKEEGVNSFTIPMKRNIAPFDDLKSLFMIIKFLFKKKPDIIHGNTPKAAFLSLLSGWLLRIDKRIYYIHGLRYEGEKGFKKKLLKLMERFSCFFSTHIFAVSNGVKEKLIEDKITNKPIMVIGNGSINGVDLEYFKKETNNLRDKYNIEKDNIIFGFVGRLVKDKGIKELVEAFIKLNNEFFNTTLLLVGDFDNGQDPLDSNTLKLINENRNIIHVGFQKDVKQYYNIMDIFVFPSYREGFGISLIEAGAMNLPSIASNISGCNEIIINNYNGYLISPKDSDMLYDKMKNFILNPDIINKMAINARKNIEMKYDQEIVWKNTIKTYKETLL